MQEFCLIRKFVCALLGITASVQIGADGAADSVISEIARQGRGGSPGDVPMNFLTQRSQLSGHARIHGAPCFRTAPNGRDHSP